MHPHQPSCRWWWKRVIKKESSLFLLFARSQCGQSWGEGLPLVQSRSIFKPLNATLSQTSTHLRLNDPDDHLRNTYIILLATLGDSTFRRVSGISLYNAAFLILLLFANRLPRGHPWLSLPRRSPRLYFAAKPLRIRLQRPWINVGGR